MSPSAKKRVFVFLGVVAVGAIVLGTLAWKESLIQGRVELLRPHYRALLRPLSPGSIQMAIQRAGSRPELKGSSRTPIDATFLERVRSAYNPVSVENEFLRVVAERVSEAEFQCLTSGRCLRGAEPGQLSEQKLDALRQLALQVTIEEGKRTTALADKTTQVMLSHLADWLGVARPTLPTSSDANLHSQEDARAKLEMVFAQMPEEQLRKSLREPVRVSDPALAQKLMDAFFESLDRLNTRFDAFMTR